MNPDDTLAAALDRHTEWLCTKTARVGGKSTRQTFPLRRADCSLSKQHGKTLFSFYGDGGTELWRVVRYELDGDELAVSVERQAGREQAELRFMPRTEACVHRALVLRSREARLAEFSLAVADVMSESFHAPAKIESARLSRGRRGGEPGRFGRLLLSAARHRVFATGDVTGAAALDVELFLANALLWFARARERQGSRQSSGHTRAREAEHLWLVAGADFAGRLAEHCALLKDGWRNLISVVETNADFSSPRFIPIPTLEELLTRAPHAPRLPRMSVYRASDTANRIVALAPEAISVVPARRGETLRFRGLGFARIRRMMNREHVWFGVEGMPSSQRRRMLTEETWTELATLIDSLSLHRRADADDHRHAFYIAASESWLESLLRDAVTRLDPGLVLAPVYAQLRISHAASGARPLDLLARRRDGRLAVIELKTAEDVALPLQAADYWRQAEVHRRAGHLATQNLFGDAPLADAPPLLYVVAPTLRFARSFEFLASLINPVIELYRFDINEDWRAGIRVQRRTRV